ncbi:MAG: DNA methyltransferase [Verrucomicrobiota bacterium]
MAAPNAVLTLSRDEMRSHALAFAKRWKGPQREEADAKSFLDQFFEVFGRDRQAVEAVHEYRVVRPERGEGRVDLLWAGKLLVEMKSTGRDLSAQKGGAAYQAFDYLPHIAPEDQPRWVLVSDFANFVLYDLGEDAHDYLQGMVPARTGKRAPRVAAAFTLDELPGKLRHFAFIRDEEQALFQTQPEVNQKAVALLGELHDTLKASGYTGHALERLLVRILFCLFAEDTDIFSWNAFTRLVELSRRDGADLGDRLGRLFQVLDTPAASRSPHLTADYRVFPYVNGGLFAERLDLASTTAAHRAALLTCCRFDWSRISPAIFGSLFQGVMEPRERRAKGAHYTSEENIRRVIDPLFLDDLKAEFAKLSGAQVGREKKLQQFQDRLGQLRFLDPACGCGNFLVVAYRELRALELEVLRVLHGDQLALGLEIGDIARVNVDQFYGIELEEFPALIAETALWLTDHQINLTFSKAFGQLYTRIPLKKSPTIVPGNALRLEWNDVLPAKDCAYVLGNPPFIGPKYMADEQRADMAVVCGDIDNFGLLDFVTAWYVKAAGYIHGTRIGCAFVSTNSISQGEQPAILWSHLFRQRVKIHFAHRTFTWQNEASGKAHVHCVIIGFGTFEQPVKRLYELDEDGKTVVSTGTLPINPYLVTGGETVVANRTRPLCAVPPIGIGNKPIDGGNYLFTTAERAAFVQAEPGAAPYFRRWIGSEEFINGFERWCLWLGDIPAQELRNLPMAMERVAAVKAFRLASKSAPTRKLAETPTRFHVENFPPGAFLVIPKVSSERRNYIPLGFITDGTLASDLLHVMPAATPFHFGVLTSRMHMAWMRAVAGRLKSDYRYSNKLVYNNYPWPEPSDKQRAGIEAAAQVVLDARAPHLAAGATLADLYDPLTMPAALLKAHQALDHAVDRAYRSAPFAGDRERVEFLFKRYEALAAPLAPKARAKKRTRR